MKRARTSFSRTATSTEPTAERWNRCSSVDYGKADHCHEDIEGPGAVEIGDAPVGANHAAEAVLAAGEVRPAEGDGEGNRRHRQCQQREIDAAPSQNQKAEACRHDADEENGKGGRQQELAREEMALRQHRRIGADAEEGAVAEGNEAGVSDEDVQRHGGDGEDHNVRRRGQRQADRQHEDGQDDERRDGREKIAEGRGHRITRISGCVRRRGRAGRTSSTSTISR